MTRSDGGTQPRAVVASRPDPPLPRQDEAEVSAKLPAGSPLGELGQAMGVVPEREPTLPLPAWLAPVAICCVVAFVPWIIYLGVTLPRRSHTNHYDVAWVGFDVGMWVVLASLAYCVVRRLPAIGPVAAVAATMLVVDAWFDVVTTSNRAQLAFAVLLAVFAELPLAFLCAWAAINAERIRERAYERLQRRWLLTVDQTRQGNAVSAPPAPPPTR